MFLQLVKSARSYRNFDPDFKLSEDTLRSLVELCRYTPSTANKQSVKFACAYSRAACAKVFELLGWAGYLEDKPPYDGNVPTGYILVCYDNSICPDLEIDAGICAQTIVLGAADIGLGACMLGNFNKEKMSQLFNLPDHIKPRLVIALGRPKETVEVVEMKDGDVRYYRDGHEKNLVPKRSVEELMLPCLE